MALTLTSDERTELERRVRSLKIRSEDARRARVVLMLANGDSYSAIEATVPCYRDYINRWRRRFLADRLEGLRAAVPRPTADRADARDGSARAGEDSAKRLPTAARIECRRTGSRTEDSSQSGSRRRGSARACSRIGSSATCSRMIRTSNRRRPMYLAST